MSWQTTLQKVLETVYHPLQEENIEWAVCGSTATALQGCQLLPGDIEIFSPAPGTVTQIANLMSKFSAAETDVKSPEDGQWLSTIQEPLFIGSYWGLDWHFGCWDVDDFEVEVVHVIAPGGHSGFRGTDGIWDADPRVWSHIRTVPFAGYEVPVVPIEIQIETNFLRWQTFGEERFGDRVHEIVSVFQEKGYDDALVDWSLRTEHKRLFKNMM